MSDDNPILDDLRKQWHAVGDDAEGRAGVIEDAEKRLTGEPDDSRASRQARLAAAFDSGSNAAILDALGVRRARPLTEIRDEWPPRLLAAHGQGGTIIAPGTVAVLAGEGGIAKSPLAVSIACGMASDGEGVAGAPALFSAPLVSNEPCPVLLATYEDDPGVTKAQAAALATYSTISGVADEDKGKGMLGRVHLLSMTGRPLFGPKDDIGAVVGKTSGWHDLWREAERIKPRLVIIDPALSAFAGEPNAATPVREFIGAVSEEAGRIGAGVLIVAHSTKAARGTPDKPPDPYDPGQVGGTAAWTDGARAALTMTWQGKGDARYRCLAVAKSNYGPSRIWCEAVPIRAGKLHGEAKGAIVGFHATEAGWQTGYPPKEDAGEGATGPKAPRNPVGDPA